MSLEGMDVNEMRGLAQQLDTDLDTLNRLVAAVNELVGRLPLLWHGPAAAAFESDWQSKHRPELATAASTLTSLRDHLVSNLNQQVAASAADGGWTLGRVLGDAESGAEKLWELKGKKWDPIAGPVGFLKDLGGKEYQVGSKEYKEYSKAWSKLIQLDHNGPFFKYHDSSAFQYVHRTVDKVSSKISDVVHDVTSPVRNAIHDSSLAHDLRETETVEKAGKFLAHTHLDSFLGPAGIALAATDFVVNVGQAGVDIKDHRYAGAIQHVGSAVQDAGPVGFLAGGTIRLLADDYQLGRQVEWSQLPNPLSGDNFVQDYLPSAGDSPLKTLGVLSDAFIGLKV